MTEVRLFPCAAPNEQQLEQLQQELMAEIGPTALVEGEALLHAKGTPLPEMVGLAVTLLTTPAVLKLIDLLRQYLMRDKSFEFILETKGQQVHIKSSDLSSGELERLCAKLMKAVTGK